MNLLAAVRLVELGAFLAVAGISVVQWRQRRSEDSTWLALTFVVLGGAVLVGRLLPDGPAPDGPEQALVKAVVVALALFPYCLFRFGACFSRWARQRAALAGAGTGVLVLVTLVVPRFPGSDDPVSWWYRVYTVAFVLDWTALSAATVMCLWRAGRQQPSVARRRMRALGLAAVAMNVGLLIVAGGGAHPSTAVQLASRAVGLFGAVLFLISFSPPRSLRTIWRREEVERLRLAEADLMLADTTEAVAATVLPLATQLVGAAAAVLTDGGSVVSWHGVDVEEAHELAGRLPRPVESDTLPLVASHLVAVPVRSGWLALQTTASTPFFGPDELGILASLGHFTGLALDRADLVRRDKVAREALAEREAQLAEAQRTAHLGSYSWDLVTGHVTWSAEMHRLLGFVPGEVDDFGRAFASRIHPDDAPAVVDVWAGARHSVTPSELEYRIVLPGGSVRWVHGRVQPVPGAEGTPGRLVGTVQDITERKVSEEALAFQALHDSLTRLPNRRLFLDRLGHALALRSRRRSGLAVLFLDLDRFKWLNDSLGHAAGDELLVKVAERMLGALRPGDTVARFGGDEFVVLCEDLAREADAESLALRFASELARPVVVAGEETTVTVSIGIAWSPANRESDTPETLLRDADAAMYQAKDRGRDRHETFDATTRLVAVARHETANALRRGMDRGELVVHYQPQLDITTGRSVGVEALVRWLHPERGLLPPADFVPLAEETGLIVPLGALVLREACRQVEAWQPHGRAGAPVALSVNLAARQLMAPDLCEVVEAALLSSGLDPALLCLEITESVLLSDATASARALHRVKALGVKVGVDDFGTGFSSLTYLKRFPVDMLKIDRSFVDGLGRNREDRAIVASVVDLAHAFGLTTVAEGVETIEQLAELRSIGCEQGQGFLWSRPMGAPETGQWLAERWRERGPVAARRLALVPPSGGTPRHRVLIVDDDRSVRRLVRLILEGDEGFEVVGEADDGREAIALARHLSPDLVLLDLAMPGMGGLEALPLILAVAPAARVAVLSGLDSGDVSDAAVRQGAAVFLSKDEDPTRLLDLVAPILSA